MHNDDNFSEEVGHTLSQDAMKTNNLYDDTNILKNGDIVYITAYVDLFNIFVRKIDDNNAEFQELIEKVNTYCSSSKYLIMRKIDIFNFNLYSCFLENNSENKLPVLNEIVGAKSSVDGYFYRARITEIISENNYDVVFIDFGFEESVNITDIVPLSIQLQQVIF